MITFAKYKWSVEFCPCISTRMKNVQLMSQKRIERGIVEFLSREINSRYVMLKAHTIKKHRVNALELIFQTDCKAFIALSKYELGATRALNSSPGPLVFLWSIVSPPPPLLPLSFHYPSSISSILFLRAFRCRDQRFFRPLLCFISMKHVRGNDDIVSCHLILISKSVCMVLFLPGDENIINA